MATNAVLSSGAKIWRSIACPKSELRLDLTLTCGQAFRWKETSEGHWTGVMKGRVWTLTQTEDTLWYHVYEDGQKTKSHGASCVEENSDRPKLKDALKIEEDPVAVTKPGSAGEAEMLRDYFQLNVKLGDLYQEWGEADPHFRNIADVFTGVRMLRQDPTECLFSFICTSNNNISRIQGMVERLCEALGNPLCKLDQSSYPEFPSLHSLKGDFFRSLWGPYAGWTQSVLFCADLKKFQNLKQNPALKRPKSEEDEEVEQLMTQKKNKSTTKKQKSNAAAGKKNIKSESLEK